MSYKDSQRFRKVYGYYRPIPKVSVEGLTDVVRDYVDGIISALDWKQSVRVTSTANVTLASPGMIDSVSLEDEDRVLLKDQTNSAQNGLYIYYAANGLIRSSDALQDILTCGAAVYVDEGTVNAETVWFLKTNNPIVVDTTGLVWKSIRSITSEGADPNAQYLVLSATGSLGSERVFTVPANSGLITVDNGAGSTFNVSIDNSIVATVSGTTFSGVTKHTAGLSGSLTRLTDGTSYLIAGTGVNIASASNGAITISSTGSSTVAGSDTQIQFNDGGSFGGDSGLTYNKTSNNLFLSGGALLINALVTEKSESLYIEQIHANHTDLVRAVYVSQTLTGSLASSGASAYGLYFNVLGRGGDAGQNGGVLAGIAGTAYHSSPATAGLVSGIQANTFARKPDRSNTTGNVSHLIGSDTGIGYFTENNFTGSITTVTGQRIYMAGTDVSRTIQNAYGVRVGISGYPIGGVGVTNVYGIDIPAMQSSGIKLGLRTQDPIVIGTTNVSGSEKLRIVGDTRSEGTLTSAGDVTPDVDKTYNLGSAEKRWANVYTGDLHLKNDRGDYTLIEEEDMLTIRFNKTGKRYKFILERVPELDEDEKK